MMTQQQLAGDEVDRGPFTAIPDYVFDLYLTPQAFRVYMHLKTLHDLGKPADGVNRAARVCLMSPNTVRQALRDLVKAGLVLRMPGLVPEIARQILTNKTPQSSAGFGCECDWCGCSTAWLHDHHYPKLKSEGGEETVAICPNCHAEFHALTRARYQIAEAAA